MGCPVPNWAQDLLAKAVGLDMRCPAIRTEDSTSIVFIDLYDRSEYILKKSNGKVLKISEGKEPVRGYQRKRPGEGHEGFL